ncbi:hypothetical protein ACOSQ3_026900 [Xanthoceras sorbifolium]
MEPSEDEVRSRPGSSARIARKASIAFGSSKMAGLEMLDQLRNKKFKRHQVNRRRQQQRPLTTVRSEQLVIAVASIPGNTVRGSIPEICEHCGRRHSEQCWKVTGACLRCGSHDHFQKDCPKLRITAGQQSERSAPTSSQKRRPSQIGTEMNRHIGAAETSRR